MIKKQIRPATIFILILMLFLVGYLYANNKIIIFNHSGNAIKKITINAKYLNKTIENVKDNEVHSFVIFAPFDKKVQVKVYTQNSILSSTFTLKGFLIGEKFNQIEINKTETINVGALGLEQ